MSPTFALCLVGGFLALAWLAHEYRTAPIIEDDTGPDPWLAEDIRACLNGIDGVPIYTPAAQRHASLGGTSTGSGTPPAGAGHSVFPFSHSSMNTQKGR